jgi:hypothetical protein
MNFVNVVHYLGLLVWIFFWVVLVFGLINIWIHGYKPQDGIVVAIIVMVFFVYFTIDANSNLTKFTEEQDSFYFIKK